MALIVKVTAPIFVLWHLVDSSKLTMGKFYAKMSQLIRDVLQREGLTTKNINCKDFARLLGIAAQSLTLCRIYT